MTKRRQFSTEFKAETAALVLDQGYSIQEASEAMGVGDSSVRKWVKQLSSERDGVTPSSGKALSSEQQEIQQLKAKVKQLELEKDILKKASALLMSDSFKSAR